MEDVKGMMYCTLSIIPYPFYIIKYLYLSLEILDTYEKDLNS